MVTISVTATTAPGTKIMQVQKGQIYYLMNKSTTIVYVGFVDVTVGTADTDDSFPLMPYVPYIIEFPRDGSETETLYGVVASGTGYIYLKVLGSAGTVLGSGA